MLKSVCIHIIIVLIFFYVLQVFVSIVVDKKIEHNQICLQKQKKPITVELFSQQEQEQKQEQDQMNVPPKKILTDETLVEIVEKVVKDKSKYKKKRLKKTKKQRKGREEVYKIFPQIFTKNSTKFDQPNLVKKYNKYYTDVINVPKGISPYLEYNYDDCTQDYANFFEKPENCKPTDTDCYDISRPNFPVLLEKEKPVKTTLSDNINYTLPRRPEKVYIEEEESKQKNIETFQKEENKSTQNLKIIQKVPLNIVNNSYILPQPYYVKYHEGSKRQKKNKKLLDAFRSTNRNPNWKMTSSTNIPDMEKLCPRDWMICSDSQNKPFSPMRSTQNIKQWGISKSN